MSDTQKDAVIHQETVDAGLKKQGALKRHCARFWWAHLIAFIVIAVLAVVLIIFVGVPKIAQKKLNDAKLTIEGIVVTDAQSGSFNMAINSTIYADDSVSATIDGFTGMMYLEDIESHEPFARVDFPQTSTKSVQTVNVSQKVDVTNLDALTTFNTWLIMNKTLRVTVEGDTHVHVKGISKAFGVTFKKTLELDGLDNFSGLNVTDATISVLPDADGNNFKGFVNIPNHSIFTLDIGNASFSTVFNGTDVGVTVLENMFLYPGNNNVSMHAAIDQLPVLTANNERPYCEGADFPFDLTGINVTNNNQNITYYGAALSQTTQVTNIPIGQILSRDLNITAKCSS